MRTIWYGSTAILSLAVDRILKWYTIHSLPPEGVFWIPGLLGLERFENPGIAFSLPLHRLAIIAASVIVLATVTISVLRHDRSGRGRAGLAFLLLGAGSNFYDRMSLGAVVDYLRIGPWSLVNVADAMIIVGLLLIVLRRPRATSHAPRAQ